MNSPNGRAPLYGWSLWKLPLMKADETDHAVRGNSNVKTRNSSQQFRFRRVLCPADDPLFPAQRASRHATCCKHQRLRTAVEAASAKQVPPSRPTFKTMARLVPFPFRARTAASVLHRFSSPLSLHCLPTTIRWRHKGLSERLQSFPCFVVVGGRGGGIFKGALACSPFAPALLGRSLGLWMWQFRKR